MSRIYFTSLLLCSTAIISTPVFADASLDELKAKLEQAQKENIILKTEKIERENVSMKLEKIEAENAALRNEARIDKTPTASISARKTAAAPANTPSPEAKTVARREPVEIKVPASREHVAARREINSALDSIPRDDARREMTAAYKVSRDEVPVVVKQWQGVYAGINAGYGYNDAVNYNTTGNNAFSDNSGGNGIASINSSSSLTVSGAFVGGQVGYNYQFSNNFILGIEADMDYADVKNGGKANSAYALSTSNYANGNSANAFVSNSFNRLGLDWIGTVRSRLGYAAGNFFPYITAGLAYGGLSNNSSNNFGYGYASKWYGISQTNTNGNGSNGLVSSVRAGWALGAGAEYMLADKWSVKGEYLYTSIGSIVMPTSQIYGYVYSQPSYSSTVLNSGGAGSTTVSNFGVHQGRIGVNYHTDWLSSKTVTANYQH